MFGFAVFGPSNASVTALKLVGEGTRCIKLTYNATQHRDAVAPRPDVGRSRSSSIEHRGGAQGWTGRAPARQEACPWPSRLVVMLLVMKGSVCWSPSAAPAPPAVWLCPGAQVVAMSVCGTRHAAEACLSCMARTGLSGLMVQSRRTPADGDDSSPLPPRRRCSVSAHDWGLPHSSQPLLQR